MFRLYVDSSSVSRAADRLLDGQTFASILAEGGYTPVVGMHTLYVLGSGVLLSGDTERGIRIFSILRDLHASFVPPTRRLLAYEVISFRMGSPVVPFLLPLDRRAMQMEIERLARGIFDERTEYFIRTREARSGAVEPLLPPDRTMDLRFSSPGVSEGETPSPQWPQDVLCGLEQILPRLILRIFGTKITEEEASKLAVRLDDFPALRSAVLANIYRAGFRGPRRSSEEDPRPEELFHLIDSAYCDGILAAHGGLARLAPFIAPHIRVLDWSGMGLAIER